MPIVSRKNLSIVRNHSAVCAKSRALTKSFCKHINPVNTGQMIRYAHNPGISAGVTGSDLPSGEMSRAKGTVQAISEVRVMTTSRLWDWRVVRAGTGDENVDINERICMWSKILVARHAFESHAARWFGYRVEYLGAPGEARSSLIHGGRP